MVIAQALHVSTPTALVSMASPLGPSKPPHISGTGCLTSKGASSFSAGNHSHWPIPLPYCLLNISNISNITPACMSQCIAKELA